MYNDKCGNHDCLDCAHCLELGDVWLCLAHRIQIVPNTGLACYKWVWDAYDNLDDDDAEELGE